MDEAPPGSSPVPLDHENHHDLMQARLRALARLQLACSKLQRADIEHQLAALDKRLSNR